MNRSKIFQRVAAIFMIIASLFLVTVVHAQIQTYEGVGECYINDGETVDFGKERAALIAERDALEQVKFYIRSKSRVVNSKLLEDEIIIIAAGILQVIDTKHTIESDDEILIVKAFVTATIDTDELDILLDNAIKNR